MNKAVVIGNSLITTISLIRCLGERGVQVFFIREPGAVRSKGRRKTIPSKYIVREFCPESMDDILSVLEKNFGNEKEKPVLLFGSDTSVSLIDRHWDELKDRYISFNAFNEQGRINTFLNKINTFSVAQKAGFKLIRTWVLKKGDCIPGDLPYPCLIKGSNSTRSTKADMKVCSDEHELISSLNAGIEYFVQEYIDRDFELDVVGLSYDHGRNVYIPAVVRKIRDDLHRQSAYIKLDNVNTYPDLDISSIKVLIGELGYEGIFSVELIRKKGGGYYFLEVNLRNDACSYIYRFAGVNYPYLWYLYATGQDIDSELSQITCHTPQYAMSSEDVKNLIDGKVNVCSFLRDFFRAKTFLHINVKDPILDVRAILVHLRQFIRKLL